MITVLRDYFKQGSRVVLWVVIAAFVIGLLPVAFRGLSGDGRWALKVNGEEIGYSEFVLEQERQRDRLVAFRQQYGDYADWLLSLMGATDPKTLAIRNLVKQELINQFADGLGMYVSSDFVANKMSDPAFIIEALSEVVPPQIVDPVAGINHKMLYRYLKHFGMSVEMFERQIERSLLDKLIMEFVGSTLYVPLFDIKQKYQSDYAKKSFSMLSFDLKDFINKEKERKVTDAELRTFFEEQNSKNKRYLVPEKRSGVMWTFDPKAYNITISSKEIMDYYENNKLKSYIEKPATVQIRSILIAIPDITKKASMQARAARIKDEILKDITQFEAIARRESDDKETAEKGGLLEPFKRGSHEVAFDRAAFLLPEDGAVSDVIETSRGLEIIQRVKKEPQVFKPLSSLKKEIEDILKLRQFNKKFVGDMKKVINDEKELSSFIADKGGIPKKLEQMKAEENQYLFKLQEGEKTFFVDGAEGVAIRLDKIEKKYQPSLEAIHSSVLADYQEQEAGKKLQQKLVEAKEAVGKTPISELQKTFEAKYTQTGWIDPTDTDSIEKLKEKGIPIAKMLQMEKIGGSITHVDAGHGFIIRVDEIEPFDADKFAEKKNEVIRSLEDQRLSQYLEGFVASLHRNAKIETNESVITLQS